MKNVYKLANSSTSLPTLSIALLRAQFMNLGEDAFAFLAGVWLSHDRPDRSYIRYSRAALCHAAAFLAAHEHAEQTVDFQTILPAVLVTLQDGDRSIRAAAVECIVLIAKLSDRSKATAVYAFDTIYGKDSGVLFIASP